MRNIGQSHGRLSFLLILMVMVTGINPLGLVGAATDTNGFYQSSNVDLITQAQPDVPASERGYPVSFSFTVRNIGPSTATNVNVTVTLPDQITYLGGSPTCSADSQLVTCTIGTLNLSTTIGQSITVLIGGSFSFNPLNLDFIANSNETDADPITNIGRARLDILSQPAIPTLLTPANGAVQTTDRAPNFSWTSVGSQLYYDLRLDIVNPPLTGYFVPTSSFIPPETLMQGTYYWQVRAITLQGNIRGQWSDVRTFTVNNPSAAPIRTVFDTFQPTLEWYPVESAFGYVAEVSLTPSFLAQWTFTLNDNTAIDTNSYQLEEEEALGNGVYWWRVRAIVQRGNGSIVTPWSAADTFAIVNLNPFALPAGSSAPLPPSTAIESLFPLPTIGQRWGWPSSLSR